MSSPAAAIGEPEERPCRRRSSSSGGRGAAAAAAGSDCGAAELTELQLAALPWHEMQLHLMFGRSFASDVIHPPMELRRQAKFKSRMRQLEGRTGAQALWSTLRDSSHRKLLSLDDKIPSGLKRTYGAFVRQLLLQSGLVPAKRNFTVQDDVEKIEVLLDKSMTLRVKDKRHKAELMSRSSRVNADRMQILAFNSSFPDLVNSSGEEGIDRYLPSWNRVPEASSGAGGHRALDNCGAAGCSSDKVTAEQGLDVRPDSSLLAIEASLSAPMQPVPPSDRIRFLTEREAVCKGQFSFHFRGLQRERDGMVKPSDDDDERSAQRADGAPTAEQQSSAAGITPGHPAAAAAAATRRRNSRKQQQQLLLPNYRPWQPLTLKALVEYSQSTEPTAGAMGDFLFGRGKMFPLKVQNGDDLKVGLPSVL